MNKEQQDLAWACLPKEARDEIKREYQRCNSGSYVEEILEDWFGDNLSSDTEPEEMLMVERMRVQTLYSQLQDRYKEIKTKTIPKNIGQGHDYVVSERGFVNGAIGELKFLFGDKCLPDKEPSAQVEPKKFFESDYGIGNKVVVCISSIGNPRKEVVTLIRQYQPQCENNDYAKTWVIQTQDGQTFQSNEEHFEPYAEREYRNLSQEIANCDKPEDNQLKDNMEEKELNLCELLKGCEEEEFYCPYLRNNVKFIGFDEHDGMTFILSFYKDGLGYENLMYIKKNDKIGKSFVLYPSRALYEKYPLDPVKAWSIWSSERKPKRWRAQRGENYWFFDRTYTPYQQEESGDIEDEIMYDSYNYFRTKEEAQQAAKSVRECLEKFQKDHSEK